MTQIAADSWFLKFGFEAWRESWGREAFIATESRPVDAPERTCSPASSDRRPAAPRGPSDPDRGSPCSRAGLRSIAGSDPSHEAPTTVGRIRTRQARFVR